MPPDYTDLIIHGAGPAGLVCALLANRCGLSCQIIEKSPPKNDHGNAHYLNAYTLMILEQCGLDSATLMANSTPMPQAVSMAYGLRLDQLFEQVNLLDDPHFVDQQQCYGLQGTSASIPMSIVYPMLRAAAEQANIPIHWNSSIASIDHHQQQVTAYKADRPLQLTGRWLIGCDGVNSFIRQQCFAEASPQQHLDFANITVEGDLNTVVSQKALLYWLYHPSTPACLVAHQMNGQHNLQVPLIHHTADMVTTDWAWQCLRCLTGNHPDYPKRLCHVSTWRMTTHAVKQMQHGWVFLVGDSAHSMTPAGGHGLNAACADAYNLIWKCAQRSTTNNDHWLASYQQERVPLVTQQVKQSIANRDDFIATAQACGLPAQWLRPLSVLYKHLPKRLSQTIGQIEQQLFAPWLWQRLRQPSPTLKRRLSHAIGNNCQHFNGFQQHLNVCVAGPHPPSKDIPLTAGYLFLHKQIIHLASRQPLLAQHSYPNWMALVFSDHDQWRPVLANLKIPSYYQADDFIYKTTKPVTQAGLVLIRPDLIIHQCYTYHEGINTEIKQALTKYA